MDMKKFFEKHKKICIASVFVLIFIGSLLISMFVNKPNNYEQNNIVKSDKTNTQVNTQKEEKEDLNVKEVDGIKNILLLGSDARPNDKFSRTDTMIIATLDTVHNKIKLTSLLRDVLVNIPGHGKSKLNHAFAFGGVDLLKETIANNYHIKIDDYALVDFNGFQEIVDELGGVKVDVKQYELKDLNEYAGANKVEKAGVQVLDGTQALAYSRIRYNSGGEECRTARQRAVISSILNKAKETNPLKYPAILRTALSHVKTNVGFTDTLSYLYTAKKLDFDNIETLAVPFESISKPGIYKNYGWVFRTDLDVTSKLLNDYIFNDKKVDLSNINKNDLHFNE